MEPRDVELIESASRQDAGLAKLWTEHRLLERELEKLERKPYLTTDEQVERNRIKKLKLIGRDQIEAILERYRAHVQSKLHES